MNVCGLKERSSWDNGEIKCDNKKEEGRKDKNGKEFVEEVEEN